MLWFAFFRFLCFFRYRALRSGRAFPFAPGASVPALFLALHVSFAYHVLIVAPRCRVFENQPDTRLDAESRQMAVNQHRFLAVERVEIVVLRPDQVAGAISSHLSQDRADQMHPRLAKPAQRASVVLALRVPEPYSSRELLCHCPLLCGTHRRLSPKILLNAQYPASSIICEAEAI